MFDQILQLYKQAHQTCIVFFNQKKNHNFIFFFPLQNSIFP